MRATETGKIQKQNQQMKIRVEYEEESQSQSGQTHTQATAPQNTEGGKWRQAVMTAEVQGTTPSKPTAGQRSSKEREQASRTCTSQRERPNGAAKLGGHAQPEHEAPT